MRSSCDIVVGNLDLVTEILLRLPVKDVARYKCVSKQWLSLISNPLFCHSHTRRLFITSTPCFLWKDISDSEFERIPVTKSDTDPSPVRTYKFYNTRGVPSIMQSCNGLLLCKTIYVSFRVKIMRTSVEVVNPTTKHLLRLKPSLIFNDEKLSAIYLCFDPLRSIHFKVVLFLRAKSGSGSITNDKTSCPNKFEIKEYSSETGSWNEAVVFFTGSPNFIVDAGVYCNGAIHWYTPGENSVYFDVYQKRFNSLPEPASNDGKNMHVKYFGEFKGHLHLILIENEESLDFDILELKEDYSAWIVRYHVDLNLIGDAFPLHFHHPFSVLCVVHQANEEDSIVVLWVDSKIVSYNLKNHTSTIIYEVDLPWYVSGDEAGKLFDHYFEILLNVGLN
ncbi:F-box protein At5g07610-like [Gastrolobium bilobum]|uniref:F-box protein At5g07610-like n=1 Tax=Gastrolobium bilobum TaxID=150636 RepID=UPI002AB14FD2|nr:F-box protein At5g07610-like [Gastrolobium bilobum]